MIQNTHTHTCAHMRWHTQDFAAVYAHFVLSVCVKGEGGFHTTPQRKKVREVYALRFVHTSSYTTAHTHTLILTQVLII